MQNDYSKDETKNLRENKKSGSESPKKKNKSFSESSNTSATSTRSNSSKSSNNSTTSDENDNIKLCSNYKGRRRKNLLEKENSATSTTTLVQEKPDIDTDESYNDSTPPTLPRNPQTWTSVHIRTWLKWSSKNLNIVPPAIPERFPNNGTELCNMTKADFWVCAGTPDGGNILSKYLAHWIHLNSGVERKDLTDKDEPSK